MTYSIGWQRLEQIHSFLEEIDDFLGSFVVGVALWFQGADTGTVFTPLVGPEGVVVALVVLPVCLHVRQELCLAEGCEDRADVGVCAGRIAAGIVCAIATVRLCILSSLFLFSRTIMRGMGRDIPKAHEQSSYQPAP